ncbi:RNA-binding protein 7-like [Coffea eugenioides]|uniref:RNA-binding protein 7-like n=1 Tax=Coffea eugenioides TaxID=49369 RepID=UPI000F611FE4|nr:RNA-binding protein 7-like [Coffea eugenioides]
MADNCRCTVYIGNLDERVKERVLYDILIQAGPVVNLNIPRHKETDKLRGFAFAEYVTEEAAEYAVKLFSGLVTLFNRTLKFSISGQYQDKPSIKSQPTLTSSPNLKSPRLPTVYYQEKYLGKSSLVNNKVMQVGVSPNPMMLPTSCRFQEHQVSYNRPNFCDTKNYKLSNGCRPLYNNFDCGGRVYKAALPKSISCSRLGRYGAEKSSRYYAPY